MKRPLVGFRVLFVLALGFLLVTGCGGPEERKAKYFDRGKSYFSEGNYDKARVEFKNVLQIDPKHADAYYHIALIEERGQDWRNAFAHFTKAVELDSSHIQARVHLGRFYLLSGEVDKATELMRYVLERDPADINVQMFRASVLARTGNNPGAISVAREILKVDPGNAEGVMLLSSLYRVDGKMDEAISVLAKAIESNTKNIAMRIMQAELLTKNGQAARAEGLLKEVVAMEPDKLAHRARLASFYSHQGNEDQAESTLRKALSDDQDDIERMLLLTQYLAERKSGAAAVDLLRQLIEAHPKEYELQFALGQIYEQIDTAKAEDVYRGIIQSDGTGTDGLKARSALARWSLARNDDAAAGDLVAQVLKENPRDNEALMLKARLALVGGDPDSAIVAARTVLKDQPEAADAALVLADAHLVKGENELARESLKRALNANPTNGELHVGYARFLAGTGQLDEALTTIDRALELDNGLPALEIKTKILGAQKNYAEAERVARAIKTDFPGSVSGYQLLGQVFAAQQKYKDAEAEYEKGMAAVGHGSRNTLIGSLAQLYLAQGKPEMARARISAEIESRPGDATLHVLLAEVQLGNNQMAEAEKNLRKAIELRPDWTKPHAQLAAVKRRQGDQAAALAVAENGLKENPDSLLLRLHLAEAHERIGEYEKAIRAYEDVLSINQRHTVAANNLAVLLAEKRGDKDSLARAESLVAAFGDASQPVFRDTAGWVYYRTGNVDKAVSVLEKVVKDAPEVPEFRYHLGMAYLKKGDHAAAKTELASAVASKYDFPGKPQAQEALQQIP